VGVRSRVIHSEAVIRYQGEALPDQARIAVISNDAIGNFVVSTVLLQKLRERFPKAEITYFSGTRVAEFTSKSDLFDHHFPLHGSSPAATMCVLRDQAESYDLVVNMEQSPVAKWTAAYLGKQVCGPCLDAECRGDLAYGNDSRAKLWMDQEWTSPQLTTKYPFLQTGFIGEIFCRLAFLEGNIPSYKVPSAPCEVEIPDVLVACSASLQSKLWPAEKWMAALKALRDAGYSVGLLGAAKEAQGRYWMGYDAENALVAAGLVEDLRGTFTMPQVVDALASCKRVLTLDNGILHLAVAAGTPVVGIFREGIHRLWAPPTSNLTIVVPEPGGEVAALPVGAVVEPFLPRA